MKFGKNIIKAYKFKKHIDIPEKPEEPTPNNGNWAFIVRGSANKKIANLYGRDPKHTCLKIFKIPWTDGEYYWCGEKKGSSLYEATVIQNVMSLYGLAPRVYCLFSFYQDGNNYMAQLTEYLGDHEFTLNKDQDMEASDKIMNVIDFQCEVHGFNNKIQDRRAKNIVNGKWVDFQGFEFKPDYRERLKERVDRVLNWHPPHSYQTVDVLGLSGRRNMNHRVSNLKLDQIDFRKKTVLDIGCSAGWFMAYATKKRARRVVGIETPERFLVSAELNYYLGYFNHDFIGMDLTKEEYVKIQFDIVLFLSMSYHVGLPDWVIDCTKKTLVYEGNARTNDAEFIQKISERMTLKEIGTTNDLSERPVVWGIR